MHSHDPDTELPGAPSASAVTDEQLANARRLIAENEQDRMQACAAEIEQVLAKHGMHLQVTQPQISIVSE